MRSWAQRLALPLVSCGLALALGLWLAPAALADDLQKIPALQAHVTDLTGTLTAAEQSQLESQLVAFEQRKGAQIAVLIVGTTQPEDIDQYSIRVVEAWKLGRAKPDDGVLLLLAKDDRKLRIEVGYGLEGALTDALSSRIINDTMRPLLQQGQYFQAVNAGVQQILKVVDGEPLPPPDTTWQDKGSLLNMLPVLLFVFFAVSSVLRRLFGHVPGAVISGGGAGLLTFVLLHALGFAIGAAALGFLVSLALGAIPGGWSMGGRGGGFGGFGGGGFGGGRFGGGGGGFSGGGGGFGGGGASGSW
ncbi:MAG TPA: YgcG family protein [Steroidobacteraceae bacterium]|nr:YgcG family protein [Steroidobacteraceae bacterium]